MPVTIIPAVHQPKPHPTGQPAESLERFLQLSCPGSYVPGETRIIASSFTIPATSSNALYPSSSSFVRSAIEAWGRHSHLVLRPEDVWFSILVQMNFFMKKNAESLRHLLVSHQGKKLLKLPGSDSHAMMDKFHVELQGNIKAPWMSDWISPGFSTSTAEDERTATVLMMGLMKSFFEYASEDTCGIPSITLLGTKRDWQRLLDKTDRIDEFGAEPRVYAARLRPILSRIVRTFDSSATTETKDFWNQMVQAKFKHGASGEPPIQYTISGWIIGFFYWDSTGSANRRFSEGWANRGYPGMLQYDGVRYGGAALETLPIGFAKAKFEIWTDDGGATGEPYKGWVLAGSIGKSIVDGAPDGYAAALAARDHVGRAKAANDENDDSGCFSGLLQGLNCFGRKHVISSTKSSAGSMQNSSEKQAAEAIVEKSNSDDAHAHAHSTIQPRSGWFLFGPEKDIGPFFDDEEIDGPTVDAINSCKGVEHH